VPVRAGRADVCGIREGQDADGARQSGEKAMAAPQARSRQPRQMDAGVLGAEISSFRLHLAAEGKAPKTIRLYTEAVAWFAAARLIGKGGKACWQQAGRRDVQEWMAWLLEHYSDAYASNQYRALQQFFKWLSAEEDLPDLMHGLRPPRVAGKLVPVFSGAERRDTALIAVLKASGIRLSELAGIRIDPDDPRHSDIDLWQREIRVRGKGGKPRIVKISYDAARAVDRYLRARARHPQAWRAQLWLGTGNRGPMTASGIYQAVARRGRQCGVEVWPHRFRHHFSHTWLERGGPEGDLMELNGWSSPQMLTRYGASARSARARRTYDRIMTSNP
jgi:integrase/recombinase XerD